jgi:hypothetical protein
MAFAMLTAMNTNPYVAGFLGVLRETFEGGAPGQGTAFLDGTNPDGSANHGLFATLEQLTAQQASVPTALHSSIASQAAHTAFHMEATLKYVRGDRSINDWASSFEPRVVNDAEWIKLRQRVKKAYDDIIELASSTTEMSDDTAGGMAATLAHAAYHLGAIRQIIKLARAT